MKAKRYLRLIAPLVVYMVITCAVVAVYRFGGLDTTGARVLQNSAYLLILILTAAAIKLRGLSFRECGLFFDRLPLQLAIGLAAGVGIRLFMLVLGSVPSLPSEPLYMMLSQLLTASSEELFWRGYLLTEARGLLSKDAAVFVVSICFALSHFPLNLSVGQLIFTFVVGALYAVMRTEFGKTVGLPALILPHALTNIF